jgi:hypothetical protein
MRPFVDASKISQRDSMIPHAATSAGPRAATKKISTSYSPYSKNDPSARGIDVLMTCFTAAVFFQIGC